MSDTKICGKCNKPKPFREFYKNSASPDGHRPTCKECHDERRRLYTVVDTQENEILSSETGVNTPLVQQRHVQGGYVQHDVHMPGEYIPLRLAIPIDSYVMMHASLCPVCSRYDTMFQATLEGDDISVPFYCCNDCILKCRNLNVNFYKDGDRIILVKVMDVTLT